MFEKPASAELVKRSLLPPKGGRAAQFGGGNHLGFKELNWWDNILWINKQAEELKYYSQEETDSLN